MVFAATAPRRHASLAQRATRSGAGVLPRAFCTRACRRDARLALIGHDAEESRLHAPESRLRVRDALSRRSATVRVGHVCRDVFVVVATWFEWVRVRADVLPSSTYLCVPS